MRPKDFANGSGPGSNAEIRGPKEIFDTMDLRMSLIRAYNDLQADKISPTKARAISQIARAITDTVRLEIQAAREGVSYSKPVLLITKADEQGS